jgi:Reverse transcriptase (RNA-dependent DNA polymerase)
MAQEEQMFLLQLKKEDEIQQQQYYDQDREEMKDPELIALLEEYDDIFKDELQMDEYITREVTHRIPLKEGARPVQVKQYPLSIEHFEIIGQVANELVRLKKIERSTSPFRSPLLVVVNQAKGKKRVCIDPRALNNITEDNMYPIPRPDVLMDQMHGSRYFTLLDLTDGYHHICIEEEDKYKTAFAIPGPSEYQGLWQWKCMPFGLKGAPATFQNYMDVVFQPYLGRFVGVYIDDVSVFSKTREEHLQYLRRVFQTMRENKIYAKKKKCYFMQKKIPYLGHYISENGIETDPKKIKDIKD